MATILFLVAVQCCTWTGETLIMYLTEVTCGTAVVLLLLSGGSALFENDKNKVELMIHPDMRYTNELFSSENYEENVLFYLYTRSTIDTPRQILINNVSSLMDSNFDAARKTLLVFHGYLNNISSPSFQHVKNGALKSHDFNVIGVDWEYFTLNFNYAWVLPNIRPVGVYVSQFIEFLMDNGLSQSDLHLIGHSIGAHAAGFAGKQLRANGHPAARITGLDPALPGFYNIRDGTARLHATDADYVDCIHTCGGILGIPAPICQADFYPNRGQNVQPGCSIFDLGICSHGRAFEYFAESFNRSHLFSAKTCTGMSSWVPYNCYDKRALMGYPAGTGRFQGLFSLTTNSQSPFAKSIRRITKKES